jgi:hypothetical protein
LARAKEANAARAVANRWTPALAKRGYTAVANTFLRNHVGLGIMAQQAMLIVHLMYHKWDENAPFPSMKTLAKRVGCCERNIRKMCLDLEEKRFLKRDYRTGRTTRFELDGLFRKLEELEAAEPTRRAS